MASCVIGLSTPSAGPGNRPISIRCSWICATTSRSLPDDCGATEGGGGALALAAACLAPSAILLISPVLTFIVLANCSNAALASGLPLSAASLYQISALSG